MSKEDVLLFTCYGKQGNGKSYMEHLKAKDKEIEKLNNKYNKALELLIDYNLPCEGDDFMNVHSDYCETHCGVDEEQYKRCWNKYIEWKIGSDKE